MRLSYQGETGKDLWVHVGCIPWDKGLDEDGNRLTYPRLRPICTEWGEKLTESMRNGGIQGYDEEVLPHFRLMVGILKRSYRDRIIKAPYVQVSHDIATKTYRRYQRG